MACLRAGLRRAGARKCRNTPIDAMWKAWQARRLNPDVSWKDPTSGKSFPLLSLWPSYIVQLPYFTSHSFNSDDKWSEKGSGPCPGSDWAAGPD